MGLRSGWVGGGAGRGWFGRSSGLVNGLDDFIVTSGWEAKATCSREESEGGGDGC